MDKWKGKVALVTGSSVGIGANLTKALANSGMTVIGLGRRVDAIQVRHFLPHLCLLLILKCSFYLHFLGVGKSTSSDQFEWENHCKEM